MVIGPRASRALMSGLEARGPMSTKENGETSFPVSPLRTHLRRVFVALAAGRGWPQPLAGPRVAGEMRDPRPLPPSSGRARSMRMDRSHRTPVPVSRQQPPLEKGCGAPSKTISVERTGSPSAAFATARNLAVPLSVRRSARHGPPNFVRGSICFRVACSKRGIHSRPVSQRDNVDGFARLTTEGGAARPNALNPAPR